MPYELILMGKFKKSLNILTLTLVDTGTHADLFNM